MGFELDEKRGETKGCVVRNAVFILTGLVVPPRHSELCVDERSLLLGSLNLFVVLSLNLVRFAL